MPSPSGLCWRFAAGTVRLVQGDLTTAHVDAVVNAANPNLSGGGGVDGALHAVAGPELYRAGRAHVERNGIVRPGKAIITPGFGLPARHVIHTVGPVWRGGFQLEPEALADAYRNSLALAREYGLKCVAFPAISCGAYGFPMNRGARIGLSELRKGVSFGLVEEALVYLHDEAAFEAWQRTAHELFGSPSND